ncbi:DUF4369 domain-containing protein [uncultured Winogradskyella sp.]|uniref:DUF4369 domain-containing protein n=1 Tax=uncultured Winogradskyella sp. TaxID=395353 RepID=UPI0026396F11|nr:DUF4369 domain-containing protein [uncultured Winogradskyella sp.]
MKQLIILSVLSIVLFSCQGTRSNYEIDGTAKGVSDGAKIYLKRITENGREHIKDTAIIADGKFRMSGKVAEPTIHFMSSDKMQGQLIFMLENSNIDINLNKDNLMLSKITGSKSNKGFILFRAGMDSIREESRKIVYKYRSEGLSSGKEVRDSLHKLLEKSSIATQDYPLTYVKKYNDNYFSLNLIGLEANKPNFDAIAFREAFENLSPELKDSPKGIKTKQKLDSLIVLKNKNK